MENTCLKLKVDESSLKHKLIDKLTGYVYMSVDMVILDDYPEIKAFMNQFKID